MRSACDHGAMTHGTACLQNTFIYNVYIRDGIQAEHGGYDQALGSSRDEHAATF
jgi:hypothetical protein